MSGKEAEARNLINRAVPREKLDEEVRNEAKRIAVIPLDGLVTGKAYTQLTMESQGVSFDILLSGYMWAGFALNIKYEPGDFKFFDVLREQNLSEAIRARCQSTEQFDCEADRRLDIARSCTRCTAQPPQERP